KLWSSLRAPSGIDSGEFYNLEEFARKNNLSATGLREVCQKKIKQYRGWSLSSDPYFPPLPKIKPDKIYKTKEEISKILKDRWKDPILQSKVSKIRKKIWSNKARRKRLSQLHKKRFKNP